jgi:putative Holliday junction resolvase
MKQVMPEQTVLGLDFGMKKMGVAIGQTVTRTATPLTLLRAKNGEPVWDELIRIIGQWKPDVLVVGRPLNMDGTVQPLTEAVENFARSLRAHTGLPVCFADERLSTVEARAAIFEKGGYRKLAGHPVDAKAAQIILQDWLNGL